MSTGWSCCASAAPDNQPSMLSCYFLSLSGMSSVPVHRGVRLSLSTSSAGWLHWPAWSCTWGAAVVLCHTMYPTNVPITVVGTCLNLSCLNTSLITELTISDVWQWSCLLAIRFTVEGLCLYFCRYMANWLSPNFAFLSPTYCGVQRETTLMGPPHASNMGWQQRLNTASSIK